MHTAMRSCASSRLYRASGCCVGLRKLARRIDEGFGLETRMGELPSPAGEEGIEGEATGQAELQTHFERIQAAHKEQIMFESEGEPILNLPEPEDENDEGKK